MTRSRAPASATASSVCESSDLLVEAPADAGIKDVLALRDAFQAILGRPVDLVTYGGLREGLDDDIRREAALL